MGPRLSLLAFLTGCLEPSLVPCGDIACPVDSVCLADRGVCASQDALDICEGAADGTLCQAPGVDGACDRELCVPSICGDGVTSGREQCDGPLDKSLHSCADYRFYTGELTCTSSCLIDSSACTGSCGDGLVQFDEGEDCDGAPPAQGCVELGHDYGHVHCGATCKDTSRTDCGSYRMRVVLAADDGETFDVWRDTNLLVVTRPDRLVVFDHGVQHELQGSFTKIAAYGSRIDIANGVQIQRLENNALVPEPARPKATDLASIAFAPNGDLWALGMQCDVNVLANGAWTTRPSISQPVCKGLAIDAMSRVYATTTVGYAYFDVATGKWIETSVLATNEFGESDRGTVLLFAADGGFELDGARAKPTPVANTTFDGVQLGETYFVAGIAAGGWAAGRPELYDPRTLDVQHARRMADGSVLAWSDAVFELDPLLEGEPRPWFASRFIKPRGGGFAYFGNGVVTEFQNARRAIAVQQNPTDIALDGDTVYSVDGFTLMSGKLGTTAQQETVDAQTIWVGQDIIGRVDMAGTIWLRRKGQSWVALPQGAACPARWIIGPSETELYAFRACATSTIDRWDGSTWTMVYTVAGYPGHPEMLDDGTIAIPLNTGVVVGRGTTWKQIAQVQAGVASGTSETDLWLGNTTTRSGLGHWDGHDLSEIANPNGQGFPIGNITASATTMIFYDGFEFRAFSRFAVP